MARDFDFHPDTKAVIIAYFNNVCAACGADDALHADHWIAGDSSDEGVCLCHHCNVKAKGAKVIPERFRLTPREDFKTDSRQEYKMMVAANREAFVAWCAQFRNFVKGRTYNLRKIAYFEAPY